MTFRSSERNLVDAIGGRLSKALAAKSLKEVQSAAGRVSEPTARNYMRGELPAKVFAPLFELLGSVGTAAAREILKPLIGDTSVADAILAAGRSMEGARHDFAKLVSALPGGAAHALAYLEAGPELPEVGEARRPALAAGHALGPAAAGGDPGLHALPAALARQLEPFRRPIALNQALALARAAGNISLGFRPANDRRYRLLYRSRLNRLVPAALVGLPYLAHPDRAYGLAAQRDMEEAESSPVGVAATVETLVQAPRPIRARYDAFRLATATPDGGRLVAAAVCRLDMAGAAA